MPFGLILGFVLPGPANFIAAWIPYLIAIILLIACLQIKQAIDMHKLFALDTLKWVLAFQLLLPIVVWLVLSVLGVAPHWVAPAVLVASAAPITGGPSLVIMIKGDAGQALDFLLIGTVLLPLTCIPGLLLINSSGSAYLVALTALKLLLLIGAVLLLAALIRHHWHGLNRFREDQTLDGLSAVVMALVVVGLMAGFHAEDLQKVDVLTTLAWAILINFVFQLLGYLSGKQLKLNPIASGVSAGNRNIALFLAALPSEDSAPLLLFIACYQIPMYLTPLLGSVFYPKNIERF
ncbi:MAG: hypothetical protein V3U65_09710 [Granulosicoccaceae bacterium]